MADSDDAYFWQQYGDHTTTQSVNPATLPQKTPGLSLSSSSKKKIIIKDESGKSIEIASLEAINEMSEKINKLEENNRTLKAQVQSLYNSLKTIDVSLKKLEQILPYITGQQ